MTRAPASVAPDSAAIVAALAAPLDFDDFDASLPSEPSNRAPSHSQGDRRTPFRLDSIPLDRNDDQGAASPPRARSGPAQLRPARSGPARLGPARSGPASLKPGPPNKAPLSAPKPPPEERQKGKMVNLAEWVPEVWESKVGAQKAPKSKVAFTHDPAFDSDPFAIPMALMARAQRSQGGAVVREREKAAQKKASKPTPKPLPSKLMPRRRTSSIGPGRAAKAAPPPPPPPPPPEPILPVQTMPRIRNVGEPPQGLDDDEAIYESLLRDLQFEVEDANYPGVRRVVQVLEDALTNRRFNLAPFPAIAARLVGRSGPPPSDDQLIDIIKSDPALAGRLVATANSVFYLGAVPVNSVPRAVARLGMLEVRRRCLAAAMDAAFDASGFGEVMQEMQTHALATAMFAEMLSPWARQDPGEAFLAGLLHDAGEVAIYRLVSVGIKDSKKRGEKWRPDSALLLHLAEHYHPRVGVVFFRGWDLAPAVLSAMAYHHHPHWSDPKHRRLTMLIHIANNLAERAVDHTKGPQWQACMAVRDPDASEEVLELAAKGDGVDTIRIDDLAELLPPGFNMSRLPGLIRSVLLRLDLSDAVTS